ncbi:MAG TPA: hypothetical protein GXZ86_04450 [Clostridiales bacterium]|jgi:uncharacterized protein YerC|nr:hypothetical protein [Clostridiales bacterium]
MRKYLSLLLVLMMVLSLSPASAEEVTTKNLVPGIQGPEGWPEDVPTPLTGEFLWGDWAPDHSFYTVDIRYTQAEIDAYAERLQEAKFIKIDTDKYEEIYGDAGIYANEKWEIVLGDEGVNGDYTYMSLYPMKYEEPEDTTTKNLVPGIQGPEGWPEDVPTPITGEFLWGDWAPDHSFYTVDIRYTQTEIDAYAERLQDAEFIKIDTDKYEEIYGDAGVYANKKWEIVLGDEGVNGDYTYMSLYPIE